MRKIKVVKPILGLEIGDVLIYNEESNTYDFASTDEQVSADVTSTSSRYISLNPSTVDLEFFSYFETDEDNTQAELSDDFEYIKPVAIKVYTLLTDGTVKLDDEDYNMKTGDKVVKGIDGTLIPISKRIFDKLFKVIK